MRKLIIIGALLLLSALAVTAAWVWFPWLFSTQYTIRIATGPAGTDGQKFVSAFRRVLAEEYPRVRVVVAEAENIEQSADVLQAGKADIAIARSDHPATSAGGTLVILRKVPIVVMVTAKSPLKSIKDLSGKQIAVLEDSTESDLLFRTVIDFYGIKPGGIVHTTPGEVGEVLNKRQAAAVIAMGPPGPGAIADAARDILGATGKPPRFLELEAKAIANQHPVYEQIDIPQGAFVAAPAIPSDEVSTVAMSVRLVARNKMLDDVAGEITRLLLVTRAKLASNWPHAGMIEPPETDKKGVLPVHPGAAAYIDGSQTSLFERAMDMLFNLSIIGGVLGSVALALGSFWRRHRPDETRRNLARLPAMLREARSAPSEELDRIEANLDEVAGYLLDQFVHERIPADRISAASTIVDQIRAQIERRRKQA
jgi:TRAP transporter TAXI family solute receptor